jgi:hypothetical protein
VAMNDTVVRRATPGAEATGDLRVQLPDGQDSKLPEEASFVESVDRWGDVRSLIVVGGCLVAYCGAVLPLRGVVCAGADTFTGL